MSRFTIVMGLVGLRYGARLTVMGVTIGTLAGIGLSRVMEQLVWEVATTDPATFIATAGLLGVTALPASLFPAWRASRADPLQTLKAE